MTHASSLLIERFYGAFADGDGRGRAAIALTVLAAGTPAALAGCGGDSKQSQTSRSGPQPLAGAPGATPNTTSGPAGRRPPARVRKSPFPVHAGRAAGAFNAYVYLPLRTGVFLRPATRNRALLTARRAATYATGQIALASKDIAGKSALAGLAPSLAALHGQLLRLVTSLRQGRPNPPLIGSINAQLASLRASSARAGEPIRLRAPATIAG